MLPKKPYPPQFPPTHRNNLFLCKKISLKASSLRTRFLGTKRLHGSFQMREATNSLSICASCESHHQSAWHDSLKGAVVTLTPWGNQQLSNWTQDLPSKGKISCQVQKPSRILRTSEGMDLGGELRTPLLNSTIIF